MFGFLKSIISPVTNLAGKMIMDKDKYAELQFKKVELEHKSRDKLLAITTTPRIDALVKLLITVRDVLIPMMRPVGSFALAAFGGYCAVNGIELPTEISVLLFGSPVGWGVSRHINKQSEVKMMAEEIQAKK